MRRLALIFGIALLFASAQAWAQQPPRGRNPLGQFLFGPNLIMRHQRAIALTEEQKSAIKADVQEAQKRFLGLQWRMQDELEAMKSLVQQPRIDRNKALAQLDKILAIEREIKRARLSLVVAIKNRLTPEQQKQLMDLRRPRPGR